MAERLQNGRPFERMETTAQQATQRIESVKGRILGVATLLALIAVLPAHLVTVLLEWNRGTLELANIVHAAIFVGGALVIAAMRRVRPRLRAGFILGYTLTLGTIGVSLYGPQIVDGGIFSISVVFAVVYFRWRGLAGVLLLTTIALAAVAASFANGWLDIPPASLLDLRDVDNEIRTMVGLLVVAIVLGWFVLELMSALDGAIEGMSSAIEERKAERRARQRTQRVLEQSRRLETIGRLAGGVAHDFNNALVVILGTAQLLERSKITTERQRRLAAAVEEAAWKASEVSKQLLTFSRRDVARPESVDVDESLRNIALVLERLLPEDIAVESATDCGGRIWIDRSELDQVFFNLAIHAHDTMRSGGSVEFSSRRARDSESPLSPKAPGVVIEVVDDGAGMSSEAVAQAFDPIADVHEGAGRSLGLPLVRDIVEAAGGRVHCFSEPGEGTRFHLWFPERLSRDSSGPYALPGVEGGPGRILLAEGSVEVMALLGRILRAEGYEVVDAATASAARAALDEGSFDLICSDSSLPGGSTRAFLESALAIDEAPPILLCSGPIADPWMNVLLAEGRVFHLAKPFGPDDFIAQVTRHLDSADRGDHG